MERSLITDVPRDKYVERSKQLTFDYLNRGDLKKAAASFVSNMNARLERCARLDDADQRTEVMAR